MRLLLMNFIFNFFSLLMLGTVTELNVMLKYTQLIQFILMQKFFSIFFFRCSEWEEGQRKRECKFVYCWIFIILWNWLNVVFVWLFLYFLRCEQKNRFDSQIDSKFSEFKHSYTSFLFSVLPLSAPRLRCVICVLFELLST